MRLLALPASLLFSILLQARTSVAQLKNDFTSYPQGSQSCLDNAANATTCSGSTGQELNQCLCRNQGNFIYNTAECVAKQSPKDLDAVYDTMQNNCAGTGVIIAVSKDAFMSQARSATATSSSLTPKPTPTPSSPSSLSSSSSSSSSSASASASSTTTSTSNSTSTDQPTSTDSPTMPTGIKIGLGVGIGFGAVALGLLGWFVWAYSRRQQNRRSRAPSPINPASHDVELSNNDSNMNFTSTTSPSVPAVEYAHHNQFERAELAPTEHEWKELPAEYYDHGGVQHEQQYKRNSGVPLLAESRSDYTAQQMLSPSPAQQPVELPADSVFYTVSPLTSPAPSHIPRSPSSHRYGDVG